MAMDSKMTVAWFCVPINEDIDNLDKEFDLLHSMIFWEGNLGNIPLTFFRDVLEL